MSIDTQQPRRLTATQAFLDALADVQVTVEQHRDLAERLHKILEPQQAPGNLHPLKLNSTRPYTDDAADRGSKSFTVLNPSSMAVALGTGGVGASNVAAITVPPKAAITLPVTAQDLELGPDNPADLQAGGLIGAGVDVYVFVITYRHIQPFYFGAWAG